MKRIFLTVFALLALCGEAQAVLQYKDEVESFFAGRSISMYVNITFAEYSCEIPEGYQIKEVLTSGGGLTFSSGVGTGIDVYAKYIGKSGAVTSWEVLKLTRSTCDEQSSCDQYKELFNPPAPDCNFEIGLFSSCYDGDGNVAWNQYLVKSSDGRTVTHTEGNEEIQCVEVGIKICKDTDGGDSDCLKPYTPTDDTGTKKDDPFGDMGDIIDNCQKLVTIINDEVTYGIVCGPPGEGSPNIDNTDDWFS